MDDPALDPATYDGGACTIWPGSIAGPSTAADARLPRRAPPRDMPAFRLLDVGFGHGDMLRRIARWARRRGIAVDLVGVDLNPNSAAAARAATPADMPIEYRTGDYADAPTPFDFVVSSLVAHHMTDDQLVAFIRFMEDAGAARGWLINDLHRHGFAYFGFPWLARLIGAHRIVRDDGQLSIARSFRRDEWRAILADAGRARRRGADRPALSVPPVRRTAALIVGGGPAGSAAAIGARPRRGDAGADRALARASATWSAAASSAGTRWRICADWGSIRRRSGARPIDRRADGRGRGGSPTSACRSWRPDCRAGRSMRRCCGSRRKRARLCCAGGRRARSRGATCGSTMARRLRADALFVATGKHELRGVAREFGDAQGLGRPARGVHAFGRRRRANSPGRSSCTSTTAAMPGCCCRRTAA